MVEQFLAAVCDLQGTDINQLSTDEKTCFFLNLFQIMHFHEVLLAKGVVEASGKFLGGKNPNTSLLKQ